MNRKGFSLIELLAIILILGIISSFTIYIFYTNKDKSKEKLNKLNLDLLFESANNYALEKTDDNTKWIKKDDNYYTCVSVSSLIDKGYFTDKKINEEYKKKIIKITRNEYKTITSTIFKEENDKDSCKALIPHLIITTSGETTNYNNDKWYVNNVKVTINDENNTNSDIEYSYGSETGLCKKTNKCTFDINKSGKDIKINAKSKTDAGEESISDYINVDLTNPKVDFSLNGELNKDNCYIDKLNVKINIEDNSMVEKNNYYLNDKIINITSNSLLIDSNTPSVLIGQNNISVYLTTYSGKKVEKNIEVCIAKGEFNKKFSYQGIEETLEVPYTGYYYIDAKGASGQKSITYGKGGEVSGYIKLNKGDILKINVGGENGYNGGGINGTYSNGGGATTLKRNNITLITAAGGGGAGEYCSYMMLSYDPIYSTPNLSDLNCIIQGNTISNGGNNNGGNGINGGGGSSSEGTTESSNFCSEYEYIKEETSRICVKYKTERIYIPPYIDMEIPSTTCLQYETFYTTTPICKKYSYTYTKNENPGEGGRSSASDEVESVSYNHNNNIYNGSLLIEYIGDEYE